MSEYGKVKKGGLVLKKNCSKDMINIHMEAINHSISSSGGIIDLIKFINKNNPYTNKNYIDFFYKNYKLI